MRKLGKINFKFLEKVLLFENHCAKIGLHC